MKHLSILFFTLFLSFSSIAQDWNTSGNNGLDANINFLGNTDDVDLRFRTDDENRMVLTGDKGWLGLHTMGPLAPFTILNGNVLWYNTRVVDVGVLTPDKVSSVPTEADGIRLMWIDSIGAFRAGIKGFSGDAGAYWDANMIGVGSMALGVDVGAFEFGSIAIGNQTVARDSFCVVIGHLNDINTGQWAVAVGNDNFIDGEAVNACTFGNGNHVESSNNSVAVGIGNSISTSNEDCMALGQNNIVSGTEAIAVGFGNTNSGTKSFSSGIGNQSTGFCSSTFGTFNTASGTFSMTMGADLNNSIPQTLALGMGSPLPTMFLTHAASTSTWGNVGFGNITAPTHLIDANGNARFRQMPSTTGNVLITGVQESGAGDYSLSTKPFGLVGQYLDGTGAWVNMPPAEQCDWNLNGQDIIMGYAGSTPVAACRSGNVGIGTHVPTGGKLTVQHANGTSVYARMGGTAASINSMHAKTSVGANSQESVAVRADNSLNTSCSSPYTASVAYGLKAYANNGEKNFAVFAEAIPHIYPGNELDTCASYESSWAGYFNGATFSPGGVWTASDEQLKTDINDAPNASELLAQISPKTYSFNHANFPGLNLPRGTHWGIMAQNLEDLVPSAVTDMVHPALLDSTGAVIQSEQAFKAVNYTELIPILIQGHKELASEKNELKAEVDALKDLVNELTALVQNCCTSGGDKSLQGSGSTSSHTADGADFDLQIEKAYLGQNVPNPFQYETSITYRIPAQAVVRVRVMDAKGQQVDTLVDGLMPKGEYKIIWNASHLPGGLYFYTLEADGVELVKKAVKR